MTPTSVSGGWCPCCYMDIKTNQVKPQDIEYLAGRIFICGACGQALCVSRELVMKTLSTKELSELTDADKDEIRRMKLQVKISNRKV